VIAMENARLITETREALEQQTATAEVLQVINSSPGDLAPVFDAILEKAHSLCGVDLGGLYLYNGEIVRAVALHNFPESLGKLWREGFAGGHDNPVTRPLLNGAPFAHFADLAEIDYPVAQAAAARGEVRTSLLVPLRKDAALLGYVTASRREVRPFTDKQIALLQNFATQAVIAMENARLLTETREALEQQTATAEVLGVINSSPGDLAPVIDAMLEKATRLCGAAFGQLLTYDGERFHSAALQGVPTPFAEFMARSQPGSGPGTAPSRILAGERVVHVTDLKDDATYRSGEPNRRAIVDLGGARSLLSVPLLKDEAVLGSIMIYRKEVQPFTDKQIALLQNFAAQAVIAMENARLITETREALEQQTATAEVLQVINSSPGDLVPVFEAMLEKAMRLCEAQFGFLTRFDGEAFRAAAMRGVPAAFAESWQREPRRPGTGISLYRLMQGENLVHVPDITAEESYHAGDPIRRALADIGGARTGLWVALRKDGTLLGAFVIYRKEVRACSDKQIALLQNFAAEALIAI